jgi:hypothetical protein
LSSHIVEWGASVEVEVGCCGTAVTPLFVVLLVGGVVH